MNIEIAVLPESLSTTTFGSLFGEVYLSWGNGTHFPEKHWTDFVGAVLTELCDEARRISRANVGAKWEKFIFRDGPFT